ncbi:MAG: RNA recognition motif domain-containing protein [Anaerolineae bacterium]
MNIYVGNLPYTVTDEELFEIFAAHGKVSSANVIRDRFSGQSRGFGFVEMPNDTEAQTAIDALNGTEMQGRTLNVNKARPRTERRGEGDRPRRERW